MRLVWRYTKRSFKQQSRHLLDVAIDNLLLFLSAMFMALINLIQPWISMPIPLTQDCYTPFTNNLTSCGAMAYGGRQAIFGAQNNIMIRAQMSCLAVGLCTCAASIKVFGRERVVYFREFPT